MDAPKVLREWRGKRPLREAAAEIGCDPSYLSLLENRKKKPSDRLLSIQLHRIVGIPPEAWDEDDVHAASLDDTLTPVKTAGSDTSAPQSGPEQPGVDPQRSPNEAA